MAVWLVRDVDWIERERERERETGLFYSLMGARDCFSFFLLFVESLRQSCRRLGRRRPLGPHSRNSLRRLTVTRAYRFGGNRRVVFVLTVVSVCECV